jgi:hypothetical protein
MAGVDWPSFLELAQRFAPRGIERLHELRRFSHLAIPQLPLDDPGALRLAFRHVWRLYRADSYHRKKALSWSGFAEFLVAAATRKLVQAVPARFARKTVHSNRK